MAWWEWIVSVLLFIVSLGALITIHEAGHLSMAKLFKVYCHEFSIGFGPKILRVKKEGHETYFSIRAIPLGGYVSMFGEGAEELEEFKNVPQERSLEGVKKWKKAIIVLAGVILNAVLAFVLIVISNLAFPIIQQTSIAAVKENSIAEVAGIRTNDRIKFIYPSCQETEDGIKPFTYEYTDNDKIIHAGNFFIVDPNVTMVPESDPGVEHHYVATFMFTGDKGNSVLTEGIKLYPAISKDELSSNIYVNELFGEWAKLEGAPEYYPNFTLASYSPGANSNFNLNISLLLEDKTVTTKSVEVKSVADGNKYKWNDVGISFQTHEERYSFGEGMKQSFVDYGNAASAVFRGLGVLFTGGIRNMSGIVGIFETSATLYSNYTFATYLYFWGMISVNLAIFNLLPFPGLDGWQLLVTIVEGVSHKKIPNKFKQAMSLIGLGLLFLLMIVILVFDVIRIVGV